jgi:nicotinamide phosphoribosyltransferase
MKSKSNNYLPATLLCDFYKISHREQYPDGTTLVYSTWTPRGSRLEGVNKVVHFGMQKFIKEYLIEYFNENFFGRPEADVVNEYVRVIKFSLGVANSDASHIIALHRLGYLPLHIRSLAEGTLVLLVDKLY